MDTEKLHMFQIAFEKIVLERVEVVFRPLGGVKNELTFQGPISGCDMLVMDDDLSMPLEEFTERFIKPAAECYCIAKKQGDTDQREM